MINREKEVKQIKYAMLSENNAPGVTQNVQPRDFSKIRVGLKTLEDAIVDVGTYKRLNPKYGDKENVLNAIYRNDLKQMREISHFFYETSGIYKRLCRYFAYLYKYDWIVTPYINNGMSIVSNSKGKVTESNKNKILDNFFTILSFFDRMELKRLFGEIALSVIKNGCYYGYLVRNGKNISIQELPPGYCRSRYKVNNKPAVEFNMKFFNDLYPTIEQRERVLKLFPKDFQKGYKAYQEGRLVADYPGDSSGWYLLDVDCAIKFNINGDDHPLFISAIPSIIDLDQAQELDKKKMMQKLTKVIVQKMPLDKNGDLIFDVDESREMHASAVRMLTRAIGLDVLTTFADVQVADLSDKGNNSQTDDLIRVQRGVYNDFGTSQMNFNSDSNMALNNSILNDEANMSNLIQQFESFLNSLLEEYNQNPKKYYYRAQILSTTVYNYKEMAKLYKEQTQLGYSKMLPQIALGQSQSSILANAYFENDLLNLVEVFVPPLSSNTMNADAIKGNNNNDKNNKNSENKGNSKTEVKIEEKKAGRPQKEDNEKSDKTIANKESL